MQLTCAGVSSTCQQLLWELDTLIPPRGLGPASPSLAATRVPVLVLVPGPGFSTFLSSGAVSVAWLFIQSPERGPKENGTQQRGVEIGSL